MKNINKLVLAFLMIAATAAAPTPNTCNATYASLIAGSTKLANDKKYAEAAAVREGAGHTFQACFQRKVAPRFGIYPFDGVADYLVASTLWRLSGRFDQASRNLGEAKTALGEIEKATKGREKDDAYVGHLNLMLQMIHNREEGRWGIWK